MNDIREWFPSLDPASLRAHALGARWRDYKAHDGQVYNRVATCGVPGLHEAIEAVYGPVLMLGSGYRLNYEGEQPNHAIHIDRDWGTHACVLYLSSFKLLAERGQHELPHGTGQDVSTGTAFWEYAGDTPSDPESGTDDPSQWNLSYLCHEEVGKAVGYPSNIYHSRWPLGAYGDSPETGRLIAVGFFSPLECSVGSSGSC